MSQDPTPPVSSIPSPEPPRKNRTNAIIIGAAAAVIAAIVTTGIVVVQTRDDGDNKAAATVAQATTPAAKSSSPSPTPSQETLKIGDTAKVESADTQFTAAVLAYRDKGITGVPEMLSSGQKWAALEVKVCNTGTDGFGVTPTVWSLAYADGARIEAAGMNAGELPQPLYPMEAKVKAGDCVRGNIAFQVPKQGRPERVLYSPDTLDEPAEWQVSKS
ncbi:DUF4352 domain-containing protein [Streptomyces sp. NPDC060027]|uniref:DUF4352 domain-containing protein n=1 Tax=Streptomyces sp. NPDC060027 TaxID=3347040 RepID=UPI00368B13ED